MHRTAFAFAAVAAGWISFADGLYPRAGDHILFYGDSITEQRLYTTYVEAFLVTRYPDMDLDFTARGVGGDTAWGGWLGTIEERVARDVEPHDPDIITIMLGMNDGGYVMPQDPGIPKTFMEWYTKLLGLMYDAAPDARITLIGTSPYDDIAHPETDFHGYNQALLGMIGLVKALAEEKGFVFVDFNEPVSQFVRTVLVQDAKAAERIVPDAIHPGPAGHLTMAAALLEAWNVSPVVSDVLLDVETHRVARQDNAAVDGFEGLAWRQTDNALPYPITKDTTLAGEHTDFHDSLNRQMLAVTGLRAGTYELTIDGTPVTRQSAEAWAEGVNLARFDTPMRAQAEKVLELTALRVNTDFTMWRDVTINLAEFPAARDAAEGLARTLEQIKHKQRDSAQPVEHRYALALVHE